jgi:hypothetical protein
MKGIKEMERERERERERESTFLMELAFSTSFLTNILR